MGNKWQFSVIPCIEESTFNNILERFYNFGISGLVRENIQNSLDGKLPGSNEPVIVTIRTGSINKNYIPGLDEIKERIKAEELEAGEVSVDEAVDEDLSTDKPIQRQRKQTRPKSNTANETSPVDERSIYGPEASNEAIKKAPEIEKKMPVPEAEKKKRPKQTKQKVRKTVK